MTKNPDTTISYGRVFGALLWLMALKNFFWLIRSMMEEGDFVFGTLMVATLYSVTGALFIFQKPASEAERKPVRFFTSPAFFFFACVLVTPIVVVVDWIFVDDPDSRVDMGVPYLIGLVALLGVGFNAWRLKVLDRTQQATLFLLCFPAAWGFSLLLRLFVKLARV